MESHKTKIELLAKYADKIATIPTFYVGDSIPEKTLNNAVKKYANGVDRTSIIGLYDTTIAGNGKMGYIFTDTKVYYLQVFQKPKKIWYDDIDSVECSCDHKNDSDNLIIFHLSDGTTIEWMDLWLNKTPLVSFFNEIHNLDDSDSFDFTANLSSPDSTNRGAVAGGFAAGQYKQVNKAFDEERFHSKQGHGFAAERANDLYDRLTGHDAKIVGDDNIKNGADRIVDGTMIQSKYCESGNECISNCFDSDGQFRYMSNGKPMQIEVPSDKYDAAVQAMEEKIRQGKVPGISDPNDAKNIVRKGHFTYEQAKNIAKAGTVESLTYDAVNGTIIASSAFGVTAIITLATNLWNGESFDNSIKLAAYSGLKVGGTAFVTTVIAGQLSKAGLNSALVGSSEAVISIMGPKASAFLINAFRNGKNIYGAAAMKSAAKLLRGNVITAGVTVVVLSSFDVINIFRGRISGKQLFKNLTNTASTVAGGTGGWLGGAAIGSAILPGVGTVIGGLIGSIAAGAAAGKITDRIVDSFVEDDAEEMISIIQKEFENLASDYLLSKKEAEKTVDKLSEKLNGKMLKDMFASKDRKKHARDLLMPLIENEISKRKHIAAVSDEQMVKTLIDVLESISDTEESDKIFN